MELNKAQDWRMENEIGWPRQQQMRGALNNSNQKYWLGTTDVLRLLIAEGSVANNQQETSKLPEVIDSWVANLIRRIGCKHRSSDEERDCMLQ